MGPPPADCRDCPPFASPATLQTSPMWPTNLLCCGPPTARMAAGQRRCSAEKLLLRPEADSTCGRPVPPAYRSRCSFDDLALDAARGTSSHRRACSPFFLRPPPVLLPCHHGVRCAACDASRRSHAAPTPPTASSSVEGTCVGSLVTLSRAELVLAACRNSLACPFLSAVYPVGRRSGQH